MNALAPIIAIDPDISPAMADLLRAGAAHGHGIICRPGQVQANWRILRAAEKLGYLRFLDIERPWITEAGRAAIGAPSQAEADRARLILICTAAAQRKRLMPEKRDDPRSDSDYRSYRTMDYVCTLVVRQPDPRYEPKTVRVGRSLTSDPQYLGPRNSILQPESEGRFVIALVPGWMTRVIKPASSAHQLPPASIRLPAFSTSPLPLDETDPNYTDEERELWERLRRICSSINSRIRNAGRKTYNRLQYGEHW